MTECRQGCGACCDPVVIPFDRLDPAELKKCDPRDQAWMLNDLTPMPYKEGYRKAAHLKAGLDNEHGLAATRYGEPVVRFAGFYRCRHFDAETRMCLNYENRPPVCSGYPWQGDDPVSSVLLPEPCTFRADIGQPVTPIDEYLARTGQAS